MGLHPSSAWRNPIPAAQLRIGPTRTMIKEYTSSWWSIRYPELWVVEEDEVCTTFTADPSLGALQISASRKEAGPVTEKDLIEFAGDEMNAEAQLHPVTFGSFSGFSLETEDEEMYQRQWWLRSGNTALLVTHTRQLYGMGEEDESVEEVLSTLKVVDSE